MSRMILVPIDISDKEFTERIISHVESGADWRRRGAFPPTVTLLCPTYTSLGLAIPLSFPAWTSCVRGSETQLKGSRSSSPSEDRMHFHRRGRIAKDKILALAKSLPADLVIIASHRPDITTYLLGSNAAAVVRHRRVLEHWWSANAAARRPAGFISASAAPALLAAESAGKMLTFRPWIRTIQPRLPVKPQ